MCLNISIKHPFEIPWFMGLLKALSFFDLAKWPFAVKWTKVASAFCQSVNSIGEEHLGGRIQLVFYYIKTI